MEDLDHGVHTSRPGVFVLIYIMCLLAPRQIRPAGKAVYIWGLPPIFASTQYLLVLRTPPYIPTIYIQDSTCVRRIFTPTTTTSSNINKYIQYKHYQHRDPCSAPQSDNFPAHAVRPLRSGPAPFSAPAKQGYIPLAFIWRRS